MFRYLLVSLVIVISLTTATPSFAGEFQTIGFEAVSMGGAGVATASGSFAPYYNPALLAEHRNKTEVSLSAGIGLREINVADSIDNLADINIEDTLDTLRDEINSSFPDPPSLSSDLVDDIKAIRSELSSIPDTNGLQVMPTVSLGTQIGNFGFGFYGLSEATAHAVVDKDRLDIIIATGNPTTPYVKYDVGDDHFIISNLSDYQQYSLQYALDNGQTYLDLTGLAYVEVPFAYGHRFSTKLGTIDLGGALKLMPGYTFEKKIKIDTESGDIGDELEDAEESDLGYGVDLGLLYKPQKLPRLSIGLVGKNLNTPEFDTTTGATRKVKPQVRAGTAYDFFKDKVTVALDADLTKNETFIEDYYSQFIGGGIAYRPVNWCSLRAGAMRNLQESNDGTILTAGLGFGLKWLQLDISGQYSTEEGEYDGDSFPRCSRVEIALVSQWN
ncbi:MAG: conjugal transfer protein TraF [Deltaproteobacteria bacterium]|nr:conjugal transfer protein TraF [Deltaproteobacteria bacterium]MBN2844494.1 conjugal transfer protein TraF [Deltaproteobacteria bacterium]